MRYSDFVLCAIEPQIVRSEGKKRLNFKLLVPGVFDDPTVCELDVRSLDGLKENASAIDANWDDAMALGKTLSAALLPPDVWNVLNNRITQATAANEGVRVRLMLSGSRLNSYPWEFILFNRAGGEKKVSDFLTLMPNVSLVRSTATPLPAWRVEAKAPIKVAVAIASPTGWPKLKVAGEQQIVERALERNCRMTFESVEHARRSQLPDKTNPAHIFHFAGHGSFELTQSPVPGANEGKSSIILEDEYGDADPLDAQLLAVSLRNAGVRVAVLGACQTAQRDDIGAWSSAAEVLLKAELGAVVGMQFPILDTSAVSFSQEFYRSLSAGLTIDEAVAAGRAAIAVSGDPRGWATPALFLRSPDGVIFSEFDSDPTVQGLRHEAIVRSSQRIERLEGSVIGVRARRVGPGASVESEQIVDFVKQGAKLTGVEADTVEGSIESRQEIKEVKGNVTGVSLKKLD
jgi:hypothetical protein